MRTDLEEALLRDRDDPRLWAVYADWLESQGDVRGALASLMLKREAQPSRAMEEAFLGQARLIQSLTPESLKTLATRGDARLAPVFRRGFLFSAGASQASDFEALIHHPSSAFLDTVILESVELEAWFATIDRPLPWRRLEVRADEAESIDLSALSSRLPFLETLTLESPCEDVTFPSLPSLRRVRVRGPHVSNVTSLLKASLPALEAVELLTARERVWEAPQLDPLILALEPRISKLSQIVLEGSPGETTRRLLQKHVFVRTFDPPDRVFPISLREGLEASFAVFRGELTSEQRSSLVALGALAGVKRLAITQCVLRLGSLPLHVVRFSGTGEVPLVARGAISHLAKHDRALDAVAFTLSGSNNVANAWSVGPHVALTDVEAKRRKLVPIARRDESAYSRNELARSVLGALAGLDPGLDVLEELLALLDHGSTEVLIGAALEQGEQLPLFTEHVETPEPADEEYEDEDEEDEEEDGYEDDEFEVADPWGAAPVNVPDFSPVEVTIAAGEDDPEDDLDPPTADAATADEDEVWTQGPVDLPEHHDALPGDPIVEPEVELINRPNDEDPCARCHLPGEVARCEVCLDDVCRACAGPSAFTAWDEERPFACTQCQPIDPGRVLAPAPRARRG